MSRPITVVLPYYNNPGMLQRQYANFRGLPKDLRSRVELIVVDDGSPRAPAVPCVKPNFNTSLYRIEVDVRWNWLACRNLGVEKAAHQWVLLTDIDHLLPIDTAHKLIHGRLDKLMVYRFSRVDDPDLTPYKPHPNSWFMTRAMFDKIGGYDERFSGYYGTDGEFRDRVRLNAREVVMLDEVLIRVPREVTPDASTVDYGRKEPQDRDGVTRIRAEIAEQGGRPHRLTFPWVKVA